MLSKLCKRHCKETYIKIVFTSFEIDSFYSVKDRTPNYLKSLLVCKFNCAKCNSCYIGKTCRNFKTTIDEHIRTDKNSGIYKHLHENEDCFSSSTFDRFSILDIVRTKCQLKIKQGLYIDWEKPNGNKKLRHLVTALDNSLFIHEFHHFNTHLLLPIPLWHLNFIAFSYCVMDFL